MEELRDKDFDCPSLLCDEELEDLETKNSRGITGKRRDGEGEVFNQREDEEAGGETGSENKDEEDKETQAGSKHEVTAVSLEDSSALSEPPIGVMSSHDLSDTVHLGCEGTWLYCPPVPAPVMYSSQPPVPPCSPMLPHGLPEQGPQPLEREDEEAGGETGSENKDGQEEKKKETQTGSKHEVTAVSSEDSSALSEPPIGVMSSRDHSDTVHLGCEGTWLYCPPVPAPVMYSSQPPVPPHSPMLPHSPPEQGPQPLKMEITQVYSIQRSILYSTTGGDHSVSFSQVPGSETVDSCPPPPAKKKRTRILYSADQLAYLEALFLEDQYPDVAKRKVIAAAVGATPERIMIWFQNQRARWKKAQRSITAKVEHRQSRAGYNSSPTHQPVNSTIPTQAPNSKGAPSFSGNFATKVPQLTSTAPSFPTLSSQTVPSHSNLQASLSSPGQSRMRDGGQHQLSSQGELAEYHPHPMHCPTPQHRASAPLFTITYNPANLIPPFVHILAHTPPLFLDAVEAGSSLAHHDSQSLQTDTSKGAPSFSGNFATKVPQLTSTAPSFPTLSNQTVPSHSNLQASLSSPGQSRMRDGGQHQLSSQGELAEYHPHPMHSPPPLHRASPPVFTATYNPANLIPPLVDTLAHTPPLFLDGMEAGSSLAHRDSQSLQTDTSKGAPSFSGNFATKVPQLTSTAPSFPTLSNQTVPSHSNLQASLSSPGQSRMRDGGQHQLSSQGELAEYHPHPMHSPPPLHRASPPVFTATYNPANLIPPLVDTLAHTPPLFLDGMEAGSSLAHRDSQSLQTDTRSFFDFGEKLGDLTSSQQNNNLPCQLQPSYPSSQPQHQPQASLPHMAYLTPSSDLTHTPPDSNPTSYLLQSAGHHGGMAEITPTRASSLLPSQVSPAAPECPPAPPCVKIEREIHSQVHFDFSPHRFFT
ncbi:mucin-3A-like isoform X3 [Acanthopagrus latus]|uniref:mucin-3A-like isoform X3 n=1 Tax=Acanthopagrus latus TaxID=8177 RepID=UPI00187C6D10|nr:mucin-3A-like isoform X3 [Acanthopagrus latus]